MPWKLIVIKWLLLLLCFSFINGLFIDDSTNLKVEQPIKV